VHRIETECTLDIGRRESQGKIHRKKCKKAKREKQGILLS